MKKAYKIFFAAMLAAGSVFAQEEKLDAIIEVENDYNPVVMRVSKHNFTPQIEQTKGNAPLGLIFSQEAAPFNKFISERNVKQVLPKQESEYPGYARLGYGNNNNSDAKFGYRLRVTEKDDVNMFASFNGFKCDIDAPYNGEWNSRMFDTWLSADYTHRFDRLTFGIKADINNKVFNYQPSGSSNAPEGLSMTDKQHSNRYNLQFVAKSNLAGPLSYAANIGYNLNTRKYLNGQKERITENHLTAGGTVAYELPNADIQKIGATLNIDGFIYNDALKPDFGRRYSNYMSIRFNPFMNFRFNDWKLRMGVHADMLTDNGTFFALAPDCRLEGMISDNFTLLATATGGRTLNTFATMEELTPYWSIMAQPTATYKIFDVAAEGRISFEPFTVAVYAGYAYTKDNLLAVADYTNTNVYNIFGQNSTRNIYAGGRFGYDYGGWFKFAAEARYEHWGCSGSDIYILYKPQILADIHAEARLFDGLYTNIGYAFTRYTKGEGVRIDNMNNLYAKISYKFLEQIGVFVQGNNLINCDYQAYPGYYAQGINFMAGVNVNF